MGYNVLPECKHSRHISLKFSNMTLNSCGFNTMNTNKCEISSSDGGEYDVQNCLLVCTAM
jgi:hypothetical protein